ncbi:MAG TPA: hypothetical protein IAC96_00040 [Candidatus Fimimorpha faecalis]|uniref:Uncharacterized protein n=1 Tax=Candidatus Fimimorpha faecalis TaxID=2840824 RepID=A0A9D1JBW9_9FIRM|nr:hypothetical protein [Candidatus Fimimorpha faecalis]
MKKLCGLMIFWTGVGMALMIFIPINIWTIGMMLLCLAVGYNCFCS